MPVHAITFIDEANHPDVEHLAHMDPIARSAVKLNTMIREDLRPHIDSFLHIRIDISNAAPISAAASTVVADGSSGIADLRAEATIANAAGVVTESPTRHIILYFLKVKHCRWWPTSRAVAFASSLITTCLTN
jgi:hypothetical protein